jgi:hypothetical protein
MAKPDGKSKATQFMPPYLRADIPAEKTQIDAIIRATLPRSLLFAREEIKHVEISIGNAFAPTGGGATLTTGDVSKLRAAAAPPRPAPVSKRAATQASPITVVPGGNVPLGWYCNKEFRATFSGGAKEWCSWYLESGGVSHYLGTNYGGEVYFLLNGQSYYLYSLSLNPTGSKFRIRCEYSYMPTFTEYSDEVVLDYSNAANNAPCVSMVDASFVGENSPCQIVGNNHGRRPKVRVVLDKPAGPGGQLVTLLMDDPHSPKVGRWVANSHFTIPYKGTSAEYDGFLGTRSVTSKKTMSIRTRVNGNESAPLTIEVKRN